MSAWYSVAENDDPDERFEVEDASIADGLDAVIDKCVRKDIEENEGFHRPLGFTVYETAEGPAIARYIVEVAMVPKITATKV